MSIFTMLSIDLILQDYITLNLLILPQTIICIRPTFVPVGLGLPVSFLTVG